MDKLSVLSLPNLRLSVVEDCSNLVNLTDVDLSANNFESKESIFPLFLAGKIASLDLRGCPVEAIENFRRWVIAHNPCLKMLDGKEVSALERRYAYNLFPELKANGGDPLGKASSKAFDDDIFGGSNISLFDKSPVKKEPVAVEGIFEVASAGVGKSSVPFFPVMPSTGGQQGVLKKDHIVTAVKPEQVARGLLFENEVLNKHGKGQGEDDIFEVKRPNPKQGAKPAAAKAESPPKIDVLSNNVVAKSFLDETTKPTVAKKPPAVATARPIGGNSGKESMDYSSMFAHLGSPQPNGDVEKANKGGGSDDGINVMIFDETRARAQTPAKEVEFAGPKVVKAPENASPPKKGGSVETFNTGEEQGESVSYEVEQICAYVMRAFRPGVNGDSNNGLFEFCVQHNQMSPDTFYVRVSGHSGVSVQAGHVPSVEKWAIDCKITLTDEVMHELLNGTTDPLKALMSGKMNVAGEVQKLLMFRDSFRFALSRFNMYQKQWNECVRHEEEELAEKARGNILEDDFSQALEFFMSVWKGQVPDYWTKDGYMLISQLPDNLFYKGFKAKQAYFPPKVVLKMSKDYVEIIPYDETMLVDKTMFCEIYGKKSIIRSLLNGGLSLRNTLALLSNTSQKQYVYGTSSYVVNTSSLDMPPFLFVRNFSSTINDFEQIMRCFDINVLSFDRFLAEKKKTPPAVSPSGKIAGSVIPPSKAPIDIPPSKAPIEWVEKLKTVKDDITKRLNTPSVSSTSPQKKKYDADDIFGSSPSKINNSSRLQPSIDSIFGGGELKEMSPLSSATSKDVSVEKGFTPKASFQDYEI